MKYYIVINNASAIAVKKLNKADVVRPVMCLGFLTHKQAKKQFPDSNPSSTNIVALFVNDDGALAFMDGNRFYGEHHDASLLYFDEIMCYTADCLEKTGYSEEKYFDDFVGGLQSLMRFDNILCKQDDNIIACYKRLEKLKETYNGKYKMGSDQ